MLNGRMVGYIKRKGARSIVLCAEAVTVWNWFIISRVTLSAVHLPGNQNVLVDSAQTLCYQLWVGIAQLPGKQDFCSVETPQKGSVCFSNEQKVQHILLQKIPRTSHWEQQSPFFHGQTTQTMPSLPCCYCFGFYRRFVRTRSESSSSLPTGVDSFGSRVSYSCLSRWSIFSPFPISWPSERAESNIPIPKRTMSGHSFWMGVNSRILRMFMLWSCAKHPY